MRYFLGLFVVIAANIVGYNVGAYFTNKGNQSSIVQNYSFVRDIAELASLEVTGVTTSTSSNVTNDGSITDEMRKLFTENTVKLTAPYTAKYGVDLKDSSLRVEKSDSVIKIYLPKPKLLSYEIHLDRLEANNKKGWFRFENEAAYNEFQKKMYTESRVLLEKNEIYLERSRNKICDIIQKYFVPMKVKTVCVFDISPVSLNGKPN